MAQLQRTAEGLAEYAKRCICIPHVYVWDANGEYITHALLDALSKKYPEWYTPQRLAARRALAGCGVRGWDCIGLIKSIDNFDMSQNVRFSTYAVPMIIGEIRRYLRDNNSIRISRSMRDTAYKAMQVKERLTTQNLREPTVEEIAKELDLPREDIVMALESIVEPVSLYEPVYSDGGDTIYVMDQVGDHNDDNNWLDEIALKEAIRGLNDREKKILNLRFFKGMTQIEVSAEIGISQAQVSRLEKGALERIKKQI